MKKIQTQGVHHITLNGADRQTSIDFWEGVLGMPFVFDRPFGKFSHIQYTRPIKYPARNIAQPKIASRATANHIG